MNFIEQNKAALSERSKNAQQLFVQVAMRLGWAMTTTEPLHWGAYYHGKEKRRYSVHFHLDHFTVKGELAEEFVNLGCSAYDLHLVNTEARISTTKSPERIAKEIERRVCEPYEPAYLTMLERIDYVTKYNAAVKEQAESLAGSLKGKARGIDDPHMNVTVSKSFNSGSTHIEATVYQTSCNWKLSIPHDLSRKIAETIATHYAGGQGQ